MIKRPLSVVCFVFLIIQGIVLGLTSGQSLVEMPASSIFQREEGQKVYLTGKVFQKKHTSNTQILYLKNNSISDSKVIVYDSNFEQISIGQTIYIEGTISHFDRAHNPGNFNQTVYYAKDGYYGVIFCDQILEVQGERNFIQEELFQLKMKCKHRLIRLFGEEHGNILSAMLLGEKSDMDQEIKELYQKNGIGHILAISGLHVSFLGLGIYKIIRKMGLSYGLSGITAILILSAYAVMIGFTVSVFRAYVMLLIKIVGDMTGRVYDMMTALLLSAALTIMTHPLYLLDAGFYLSYGAVLGILLFSPFLEKRIPKCLVPGLCVNIALVPIQLWFYNEFPLYSVVMNLIVIPLMTWLLATGIFALLTGWHLLTLFCKVILELYDLLSHIGVQLPFARIVTGQPDLWKLVVYYIVLAFILFDVIKRQKVKVTCYVCCFFLLFLHVPRGLQITMMDVGQGDGIFMRGPSGTTYLVDGGSSDVKELGKYRLEPYLKHVGVGKLDYVFISHGDMDHCSGVQEMLQRQELGIAIRNLVFPENYESDSTLLELMKVAKENGTAIKVMKKGMKLREGDLTISCIQPEKEDGLTGNEGSMVLEAKYGEFSMLFTGDVEEKGEEMLSSEMEGKHYQVLKVAHHGSKNSTLDEFLEKISVDVALISAGKQNSYGHPNEETLERLKHEKCKVYTTIEKGAITLRVRGGKMSLEVFH